jgi:hypothetical protein
VHVADYRGLAQRNLIIVFQTLVTSQIVFCLPEWEGESISRMNIKDELMNSLKELTKEVAV